MNHRAFKLNKFSANRYQIVVIKQFSKRLSITASCLLLIPGLPSLAQSGMESLEMATGRSAEVSANKLSSVDTNTDVTNSPQTLLSHFTPANAAPLQDIPDNSPLPATGSGLEIAPETAPILIAQTSASCTSCGSILDPVLLMGSASQKKNKSLLTDSLWGNLILELAYQRDKELAKLAKRMNLVNLGTNASIGAIALGTLGQGVGALATLNPPSGHEDSYGPGIVGTTLSTVTIMTFAARMYFNHKMQKDVQERQIAIRTQVESVLNHLERSDSKCPDAQKDLTELIGERASHEWLQLWQSSHQLAMTHPPRVTLNTTGSALAKGR
jgi:hypothetical protein